MKEDNQSDVFNFGADDFNIKDIYTHYYSNVRTSENMNTHILGQAISSASFLGSLLLRCDSGVWVKRIWSQGH